ncbi:hypothetical protein BCR44DRAFT_1514232 [Catenaria anguillulae PL171]|uniref:Transmembrane protein n=1 Tax=Catenaria anguillulae PL171 TaxID=765915 RepID=A0A1Y2HJ78_9FUNG|nr:hypothetical protein BCR44DRAFT_1514232 [Catenaria anguillulae PL171]
MSAADLLTHMHMHRGHTAGSAARAGVQNGPQFPAAMADPLRLAQSSSSSLHTCALSSSFGHRVSSSSSSSKSNGGLASTMNQQHAFRAKGAMSPDGKFEFEAEMGSATSAVKLSRNMEGGKGGKDQGDGAVDSSWSIPVSEVMQPNDHTVAGQPQVPRNGRCKQEKQEPVIQFPAQTDSSTFPSSESISANTLAKPLHVTETFELSTWPATWTWVQANKVVVPLMLALLLSAILARWITMRRALGAHRARRAGARKRVHQEQVVEVEQVVDQFMTDEKGNVIGVEETVSQRDWKFEAVRIPFWYTLSTLATLVVCVVLDFLVLRTYTLPVAPPTAAAVNHPLVDFGLAVLHMGVVAATMASLARTIGFVRRNGAVSTRRVVD